MNADADAGTHAWHIANGLRTERHYRNGRLRQLSIGTLHNFRYHYGPDGRITGIDEGPRPLSRYRFDAAGRLALAPTPAALYGYRYDANGNRITAVVNGQHWRFAIAADSNRLLGVRRGRAAPPPSTRIPMATARPSRSICACPGNTPTPNPACTTTTTATTTRTWGIT